MRWKYLSVSFTPLNLLIIMPLYGVTSWHLSNSTTQDWRICMTDYRVHAGERSEDQLTAIMESYSAQWPTSLFLGAAFGSMLASLVLKAQGKDNMALFIGQWAAPFLILGTYNKMVKQHGSDAAASR
jgi:hypothetical protein